MYSGKHDDTLNALCYINWNEAVMVSEDINPENLPPTCRYLSCTSSTLAN